MTEKKVHKPKACLIGDKTRKGRKKKPISHLGEDIAEARRRGISYGYWMARKTGILL